MSTFGLRAHIGKTVLSVVCVLGVCLASTATAFAATAIHFERESLPALEGQLHQSQVHALTFHPGLGGAAGHIHVSLNDGRHMTVAYASSEQEKVIALASADHTPVTIAQLKTKAAAKPVHHKLRYVAAGILVVVIVVVLAVLLIDRRRKLGKSGGASSESAPVPSSSGEQT